MKRARFFSNSPSLPRPMAPKLRRDEITLMLCDALLPDWGNLENLLDLMVGEDGSLEIDFGDDILDAACITRDGEIRGERTAR